MRFAGIVIAIFLLACTACQKATNDAVSGGGKGGNATLFVIPEHHQDLIASSTVYIRYDATSPPDSVYDDSCVVSTANSPDQTKPVAVFRNLTAGSYYIFAKGYHPSYNPPYVKGGVPYTIHQEVLQPTLYVPVYSYQP